MKRGAFNYIKDILLDYPRIEEYIKQRENELRYPHRELDDNSGIKGTRVENDSHIKMMITIEKDRRLSSLERNRKIIDEVMDESDTDTITIIQELYMKKRPNYTMQGLIESNKIFASRSKAHELRNDFFEEVARKLELDY